MGIICIIDAGYAEHLHQGHASFASGPAPPCVLRLTIRDRLMPGEHRLLLRRQLLLLLPIITCSEQNRINDLTVIRCVHVYMDGIIGNMISAGV